MFIDNFSSTKETLRQPGSPIVCELWHSCIRAIAAEKALADLSV